MPRKIDLKHELVKIAAQMKDDPTYLWPFLGRVPTPLYHRLIEDCIRHNDQPLAHRIVDILTHHYRNREQGGVELDPDQAETLKSLSTLWGVDARTALKKVLEKVGTSLLEQEIADRHKKMTILKSLHHK